MGLEGEVIEVLVMVSQRDSQDGDVKYLIFMVISPRVDMDSKDSSELERVIPAEFSTSVSS